jgi:hypothetical protein
MSTATLPAPVAMQKASFLMPRASVGMSIIWYPYGETDKPGMPGLVCEVGQRTLSLSIFLPHKTSVMYKDGVRHLSDPEAKNQEFIESGCWDFSEQTKDMIQLRADIERFRAAVE